MLSKKFGFNSIKGTIKTVSTAAESVSWKSFNSIKGTIKTPTEDEFNENTDLVSIP